MAASRRSTRGAITRLVPDRRERIAQGRRQDEKGLRLRPEPSPPLPVARLRTSSRFSLTWGWARKDVQMSDASRRNVEKAGFLVALAIAVILMTVLVTITIRNATQYGVTVWQMDVRP